MTDADAAEIIPEPDPKAGDGSTAISLLVGAATAVGVVGFATVVGGVITWIPFKYANLPADQSVAVKPRTELLAVGIARLIPLLLISAAVLVVLFVIEQILHPTKRQPSKGSIKALNSENSDIGAAILLAILAALLPLAFIPFGEEYVITAVIGVFGVSVSYYVFWRTGSYVWFAISVLSATTLYASALSLARTSEAPKLQAVALLTSDSDTGVRGILVAETADRVYLARIMVDCSKRGSAQGDPESARIIIVPREDIVAMSVGPPQLVCNADARSELLLSELQALDLP